MAGISSRMNDELNRVDVYSLRRYSKERLIHMLIEQQNYSKNVTRIASRAIELCDQQFRSITRPTASPLITSMTEADHAEGEGETIGENGLKRNGSRQGCMSAASLNRVIPLQSVQSTSHPIQQRLRNELHDCHSPSSSSIPLPLHLKAEGTAIICNQFVGENSGVPSFHDQVFNNDPIRGLSSQQHPQQLSSTNLDSNADEYEAGTGSVGEHLGSDRGVDIDATAEIRTDDLKGVHGGHKNSDEHYRDRKLRHSEAVCPVCQERMAGEGFQRDDDEDNDHDNCQLEITILRCGHALHLSCLLPYLMVSADFRTGTLSMRQQRCPICRDQMSLKLLLELFELMTAKSHPQVCTKSLCLAPVELLRDVALPGSVYESQDDPDRAPRAGIWVQELSTTRIPHMRMQDSSSQSDVLRGARNESPVAERASSTAGLEQELSAPVERRSASLPGTTLRVTSYQPQRRSSGREGVPSLHARLTSGRAGAGTSPVPGFRPAQLDRYGNLMQPTPVMEEGSTTAAANLSSLQLSQNPIFMPRTSAGSHLTRAPAQARRRSWH